MTLLLSVGFINGYKKSICCLAQRALRSAEDLSQRSKKYTKPRSTKARSIIKDPGCILTISLLESDQKGWLSCKDTSMVGYEVTGIRRNA